ncbi:MAG: alpha-galactosidase, partial [Propionibacteriales bacterium]|nr:alpha-galactosidase [Propionibacteriales bacterium]
LKWDHNRDLIEAGSGRPGVHGQTLAVYRLLDELRVRHPDVEIESCSSGGARVDLGILLRTDRVWASDTNDALERQQIQRWTGLLLPPELVGSHVGPPRSHTTGRRHELSLRAITALFGHVGIEWDIATASDSERAELAGWVAIAKSQRDLIHTGDIVRIDEAEPGLLVHGVVAADRTRALFAVVAIGSRSVEPPPLVRFAGLDPTSSYRLVLLSPDVGGSAPSDHVAAIHRTNATSGVTQTVLPGSAFMRLGWRAPAMTPESALLIRLDSEVTDH